MGLFDFLKPREDRDKARKKADDYYFADKYEDAALIYVDILEERSHDSVTRQRLQRCMLALDVVDDAAALISAVRDDEILYELMTLRVAAARASTTEAREALIEPVRMLVEKCARTQNDTLVSLYSVRSVNSHNRGGLPFDEAVTLFRDVVKGARGADAVAKELAALDLGASANASRLPRRLANTPADFVALDVETIEQTRARATEATSPIAREFLTGSALLREGNVADAAAAFDRVLAQNADHYGATRGLTAAQRFKVTNPFVRFAAAASQAPAAIETFIVGWQGLTSVERNALHLYGFVFGEALARAAEQGDRIRVLPLDVRPEDAPEFADLEAGEHAGAASAPAARIEIVGVEELIDVSPESPMSVARSVARVLYPSLRSEDRAEFEAAMGEPDEAHDEEGSTWSYASEFFADSFVAWLRHRMDIVDPHSSNDAQWNTAWFENRLPAV